MCPTFQQFIERSNSQTSESVNIYILTHVLGSVIYSTIFQV